MTDHPQHVKERMAVEAVGAQRERERIVELIRTGPDGGKSRFINREWLLRQIEKGG